VNDDIMNKKIGQPIQCNANANKKTKIIMNGPGNKTISTRDSKNEEKGIVLFKKAFVTLMVIPVKVPKKPVHNEFVGKPRNKLHGTKSEENN
jgi:hypothetical protein